MSGYSADISRGPGYYLLLFLLSGIRLFDEPNLFGVRLWNCCLTGFIGLLSIRGKGWSSITWIFLVISFSISFRYSFSSASQNEIAVPLAPALPVLPIRWTYVSEIFGISKFITYSRSSTSIPRAAISVATRTLVVCALKLESAFCRAFWALFPWIASALIFFFSELSTTLSAPYFVRVNTNARFYFFILQPIPSNNELLISPVDEIDKLVHNHQLLMLRV